MMSVLGEEDLIKKWLKNGLTPEEQRSFEAIKDASLLNEIVIEAKRFKVDVKVKDLKKPLIKQEKRKVPLFRINTFYRIAAILILAFGLFNLIERSDVNQISSGIDERQTVTLPDKSMVTLNELSQIQYNERTWEEKRSLVLKGEAFFDVASGKRFDVITSQGRVSVLGTEFSVVSREESFKVTCYEGKVKVSVEEQEVMLIPGQKYVWENGAGQQSEVIIRQPVWLSGLSVFDNVPLEKVLEEMERHYQITFDFSDIDSQVLFSGAFELDSLKNALQAITKPLHLTYEYTAEQHVILKNVEDQ